MIKEFKKFAMRGNVLDMAVGIIIGAAFGAIVKTLVDDVLMPPLGLLIGNVDFSNLFIVLNNGNVPGPYETLASAKSAGAVILSYGLFLNTIINFLIVAFAVFLLIKAFNAAAKKDESKETVPAIKICPYCNSTISIKATRCPHCTSQL